MGITVISCPLVKWHRMHSSITKERRVLTRDVFGWDEPWIPKLSQKKTSTYLLITISRAYLLLARKLCIWSKLMFIRHLYYNYLYSLLGVWLRFRVGWCEGVGETPRGSPQDRQPRGKKKATPGTMINQNPSWRLRRRHVLPLLLGL